MPVKKYSESSLSEQLKKIANRYFSGVEITKVVDDIYTYSVESGYHQTSEKFAAQICLADNPLDSVIKIVSLGAEQDKLERMAEAFCTEVLDCEVQV